MKMFINGAERDARDGAVLNVYNSANMELIDTVPAATEEDVKEAVITAYENSKNWSAVPVHERGRILYQAADMIEAHADELALSLSTEMGKILRESRGEVSSAVQIIRGYVEEMKHFYGKTITTDAQKRL
jgi:succinate-semialdehyde dehydrogenase/glutarate-semialdehyde dehydrogenase